MLALMVLLGNVIDMKHLLWLTLRLLADLTTLLGSRGTRAVRAENLLLKRQLLVLRRPRRRGPNLRVLGVEAVPTVPRVPWSHPFVERLVVTIRREYLDCPRFWNAADLERKLEQFKSYYNQFRVHQSLEGARLEEKGGGPTAEPASLEHYSWQSHCHGLFELPVAA